MIKIETKNETPEGYDIETTISGTGRVVIRQLTIILDRIYENFPEIFEMALLDSKYTKDHT